MLQLGELGVKLGGLVQRCSMSGGQGFPFSLLLAFRVDPLLEEIQQRAESPCGGRSQRSPDPIGGTGDGHFRLLDSEAFHGKFLGLLGKFHPMRPPFEHFTGGLGNEPTPLPFSFPGFLGAMQVRGIGFDFGIESDEFFRGGSALIAKLLCLRHRRGLLAQPVGQVIGRGDQRRIFSEQSGFGHFPLRNGGCEGGPSGIAFPAGVLQGSQTGQRATAFHPGDRGLGLKQFCVDADALLSQGFLLLLEGGKLFFVALDGCDAWHRHAQHGLDLRRRALQQGLRFPQHPFDPGKFFP